MLNTGVRPRAMVAASVVVLAGTALDAAAGPPAPPQGGPAAAKADKPEYPPFDKVVEDLEKVISTADGAAPLYDLYRDRETGRLLAVLPGNYQKQLVMIACTISGGDPQAGVMGPTHYVKWRKIGKQLVLIEPNLYVRTDGDREAKDSIKHLYTGRVVVATPILSMAPGGRPVIDLGMLSTAKAGKFFGQSAFGPYGAALKGLNPQLAALTKAKAFPENIIYEYEAPRADGRLVRLTYAIGELEGTPGYKPRKADPRVGYFYNWHQDFARTADRDVTERYIIRWNLEKADPKLSLSPPKEPIVWYIEHTTPIRFRRYVREGILMWNDAFEATGIVNAVEVYQQDAATGAHMDKDPEDARYNFFRWNASDQGYAIGPSRSNPKTGEILDADVVWHQGLTRAVRTMLEDLSDDLTEQTFSPETLAWLDDHPNWDPRVRLASPAQRAQKLRQRALDAHRAVTEDLHSAEHPWTHSINDPTNAECRMGRMLSLNSALIDAALVAGVLDVGAEELLDGLPEEYIGPMIRYIAGHEVGHCLGLQHNMAASSIRTLEEINSKGFDGPTVGSIMDYVGVNINHELGEVQGPYASPELGPYDMWAVAYGYGPDDKLDEVLSRVSEPDNIFVSQLAMAVGSDPRNMVWDIGADNLNFAESRISLAQELRAKLIEKIVKEGESWKTARDRLNVLLGTQLYSVYVATNWIGGSYINNDFKGDPGDRAPIEDIPADVQRRALVLVIDNAFEDEAFGLTPDLLRHLGREYWWDPAELDNLMDDPSYDVHDVVGGIQAVTLTLLMNPTKLRRLYDNEYRAQDAEDVLTLAEVVTAVTDAVWRECAEPTSRPHSAESPMISSFRRNLQREHVQRLIDLALLQDAPSPALRTISSMATQELRRIDTMAGKAQNGGPDAYTVAHLADVRTRIDKALEAAYVLTP
ncbi:MAG: zinc-dependent metalloprotease [Planctomycetota bacterium]